MLSFHLLSLLATPDLVGVVARAQRSVEQQIGRAGKVVHDGVGSAREGALVELGAAGAHVRVEAVAACARKAAAALRRLGGGGSGCWLDCGLSGRLRSRLDHHRLVCRRAARGRRTNANISASFTITTKTVN